MSVECWSAVKVPGCPGRAVVARFDCVGVSGGRFDTRELELRDTYSIPDLPTYTPKIQPPGRPTGVPSPLSGLFGMQGGYVVSVLTLPTSLRFAQPVHGPLCIGERMPEELDPTPHPLLLGSWYCNRHRLYYDGHQYGRVGDLSPSPCTSNWPRLGRNSSPAAN